MSIAQICDAAITAFEQKGIQSPRADARILIGRAFGLDRAALISQSERRLTAPEVDAVAVVLARRLTHEPVAHIVGVKEFWSLPLKITPAVLVPRPDTETVVEAALDGILERGLGAAKLRILDIGTGSGALLLALLSEFKNASGIGTDISSEAIDVARENAEQLGFAARSRFVVDNFAQSLDEPFDLIVSNPPYVRSDDIDQLAPEVRDFDPKLALDGGVDGLSAYRAIAAEAHRLLAPGGQLIVELGIGQDGEVAALLKAVGLSVAGSSRKDLNGINRALSASLP
ncbi:MAG: peptide chain release factor N(5)-glutamine methyltransferase [Pseudolabrys sp.]|nr:peptide chain release factor N(5)-glutamine methyltransferase [Pseudolabrys sp.]